MKKILALSVFCVLILFQFACNQQTSAPLQPDSSVKALTGPPTAVLTLIADNNPHGGPPGQLTKTPVPTATPTYKIVFEGFSGTTTDGIWTANWDGSNPVQLTNAGGEDLAPRFSFDRTKIVFNTERFGSNWAIAAMNADGTNVTSLTTNTTIQDTTPSWSPDGTQVLFASSRAGNGWFQLYLMNSDGTNLRRLTNEADTDQEGVFSPNGTKIVFRQGDSLAEINADGTNMVALTPGQSGMYPAFSPDGTKIAFISYRSAVPADVYTMNADGTGVTRLTTIGGTAPQYSPDGRLIYFYSYVNSNGYPHIWMMNADGTGQVELNTPGLLDSNF